MNQPSSPTTEPDWATRSATASVRGPVPQATSSTRLPGATRAASATMGPTAQRALGGLLDDSQFGRLNKEAETELSRFVQSDGTIVFDMPALIMTAEAH